MRSEPLKLLFGVYVKVRPLIANCPFLGFRIKVVLTSSSSTSIYVKVIF
jgi:hypothetical protein